MAIHCKKVKELLDRYHDGELHGPKRDSVSEHLAQCEDCSGELQKVERVGQALKSHFDGVAVSEDLSNIWERVDAAIDRPTIDVSETFRDKLIRIFAIPKPAWAAVGAVAIALVLALSYLPGNNGPVMAANDCIIDSVDTAPDCSVMVYELEGSRMKVIWIMEEEPGNAVGDPGVAS